MVVLVLVWPRKKKLPSTPQLWQSSNQVPALSRMPVRGVELP